MVSTYIVNYFRGFFVGSFFIYTFVISIDYNNQQSGYNYVMEIKDLLNYYAKFKKVIALFVLFGGLLGASFYFLPKKYVATGSLYITRGVEESSESFFNYEGYYGQQAALSYTNTVAALAESLDIREKTLEKLGIPASEEMLRKYDRRIKVTKSGPQLVTISVKETQFNDAEKLWSTLTDTLIEESGRINQEGDYKLNIAKVSVPPVVNKEFNYLPLSVLVGAALGGVLALFGLGIRSWLR